MICNHDISLSRSQRVCVYLPCFLAANAQKQNYRTNIAHQPWVMESWHAVFSAHLCDYCLFEQAKSLSPHFVSRCVCVSLSPVCVRRFIFSANKWKLGNQQKCVTEKLQWAEEIKCVWMLPARNGAGGDAWRQSVRASGTDDMHTFWAYIWHLQNLMRYFQLIKYPVNRKWLGIHAKKWVLCEPFLNAPKMFNW